MAKTYTEVEKEAAKVDEQGILDRFNAATTAQFNIQREQNRQAENAYYNQMYNTQKTAMDTIRQNNAAAVATGASRGVQAANELSAILGLQQESVAGATEVAQAHRQTAQEETAAVLENVLKAYQQAEAERQNRRTAAVEAASVDAMNLQTYTQWWEQAMASQNYAMADYYAQKIHELGGMLPTETPTTAGTTSKEPGETGSAVALKNNVESGNMTPDNKQGAVYEDGTPVYNTEGKVIKTGLTASGTPVFAETDITDKNTANIYGTLGQAGIEYDNQVIIDISNPEDYGLIDQTDFNKTKQKGEAANYINKIKADAAAGLIPVGARVVLNYGKDNGKSNYECIYLGGTSFAWVKPTFEHNSNSEFIRSGNTGYYTHTVNADNVYIPTGYKAVINPSQNAASSYATSSAQQIIVKA